VILVLDALALYALYAAWQTASPFDWFGFWMYAGFAALLSLAALPGEDARSTTVWRPDEALALREAVARQSRAEMMPSRRARPGSQRD
jgi:hypothetical protein